MKMWLMLINQIKSTFSQGHFSTEETWSWTFKTEYFLVKRHLCHYAVLMKVAQEFRLVRLEGGEGDCGKNILSHIKKRV